MANIYSASDANDTIYGWNQAKPQIQKISQRNIKKMRCNLKKFLLIPKLSPTQIQDKMCGYNIGKIYGIVRDWNKKLIQRKYMMCQNMNLPIYKQKRRNSKFHKILQPQVTVLMQKVKKHNTRLNVNHIKKEHQNLGIDNCSIYFATWKKNEQINDQKQENCKLQKFKQYLKDLKCIKIFIQGQGRILNELHN